MGREAKREGVPPEVAALPPSFDVNAPRPFRDIAARKDTLAAPNAHARPRWFGALHAEAARPVERRGHVWMIPLLVAALVLIAITRSVLLRALLPIALAVGAILVLLRRRRPRAPAAARASRRGLSLVGDRLGFQAYGHAAPHVILSTAAPFGVTLLAAPKRDRMVALLSGSAGPFYVGASFDPGTRRTFCTLLDRASIVGTDEAGLAAIGPDGEPITLAPAELADLVDELTRRSPGCLDRFFLTDARGAPLTLDGRELRAGNRTFDLGAALEWRAFVFQEPLGQAIALYQGTWVRQGANEIVLVCLLPAITPAPEGEGVELASLDRSALRDLRLMQGAPEDPPATDQRVAIDRLVMVPIRSALDKAPRPAAQPARARA